MNTAVQGENPGALTPTPGPTYNYSMRVVELRDIRRKDSPVHYIKELTAVAVVEWNEDLSESEIAITLEHKALGPPEVRVRFLGSVEWPTSTVIPDISDRIVELERTGGLP